MYQVRLRVFYPLLQGRLVLRTDQDWDVNIEPVVVDDHRTRHEFLVHSDRPYLSYKPCIIDASQIHWSQGSNKLMTLTEPEAPDIYPRFFSGVSGRITDILEVPSAHLDRRVKLRVYLPPGYAENTLKCYPVVYMHDGRNLFFPEESFLGMEWEVDENLDVLDMMSLIDQTIIVGVHAGNRIDEYTMPGYETYGRALTEHIKPWVDQNFRTLPGSRFTAAMGSSLGGVVSFYLGWQFPDIFGNVACLSSTFAYRDNLFERVLEESIRTRRRLKIYLDSGWPGDNYEVTVYMANALVDKGFMLGRDLLHLAFPWAVHSESAWAERCHLPLQLFSGKVRRDNEPPPVKQRRPGGQK